MSSNDGTTRRSTYSDFDFSRHVVRLNVDIRPDVALPGITITANRRFTHTSLNVYSNNENLGSLAMHQLHLRVGKSYFLR